MIEAKPRADVGRHPYVEGVHTRTGKDGRVYRLCRVCDDRANAWTHRGYRVKGLSPRERAEKHPFDPTGGQVVIDARGHRYPACRVCGQKSFTIAHRGLATVPTPTPLRVVPVPHDRTTTPSTPVRTARDRIRIPDAEVAGLAIAIDRVLALPDDVVDWKLRLRLQGARELIDVPVFPTLDRRLVDDGGSEDEGRGEASTLPTDSVTPTVKSTPLPPSPVVNARRILTGIRSSRVRELAKRAQSAGFELTMTGGGHLAMSKGSHRIITSMTMADSRRDGHGWGNLRSEAKRAGIDVTGL